MNSQLLCAPTFLIVAILIQVLSVCWSKVIVSTTFVSFHNPRGILKSGGRCDTWGRCDNYLIICLDEYNGDLNNINECVYGKKTTGVFDGKYIMFNQDLKRSVQNPILVNIPATEEGILLKVEVWDSDGNADDLVGIFVKQFNIGPSLASERGNATVQRTVIDGGQDKRLSIDFSAYCAEHYFLNAGSCETYCKDQDDESGHFNCSNNGSKICLKGWVDDGMNCTTRKPNCSDDKCLTRATCEEDTSCVCSQGMKCADVTFPNGEGRFSSNKSNDNKGLIVGLVVGFLLVIIIVIILVLGILILRRKRMSKEHDAATLDEQRVSGTIDSGYEPYTNPYVMDKGISTNHNINQQMRAEPGNTNGIGYNNEGAMAETPRSLPYIESDIPTEGDSLYLVENPNYGDVDNGR